MGAHTACSKPYAVCAVSTCGGHKRCQGQLASGGPGSGGAGSGQPGRGGPGNGRPCSGIPCSSGPGRGGVYFGVCTAATAAPVAL
jgi:hypothetical protein